MISLWNALSAWQVTSENKMQNKFQLNPTYESLGDVENVKS